MIGIDTMFAYSVYFIIISILLCLSSKFIVNASNDICEYTSENKSQTLADFCLKNIHQTIQPIIQPFLCPSLAKKNTTKKHYICDRFVATTNISMASKIYLETKLNWQKLLNKFVKHLTNRQVIFLGDSLMGNIKMQLQCLGEFTNVDIMKFVINVTSETMGALPIVANFSSMYRFNLAQLQQSYNLTNESFKKNSINTWYNKVRKDSNTFMKQYLVINTGMHFNYDSFINLKTNTTLTTDKELLDLYRIYFCRDGPFLMRLDDLIRNYNVTVLWRDTTPAGSCELKKILYPNHKLLSTFNDIAHAALKQIGVLIIPKIWEISLPYWKLHLMGKNADFVHYCLYQNQTVENRWIEMLVDTILQN